MRTFLRSLGLLLGLAVSTVSAEPLAITSASLSRFALLTNASSFGPLTWRGGIELTSANEKFGGLSGLIMADECTSLRAVSDAGRWITADVAYTGDVLSGLTSSSIAPILDDRGKPPPSKRWGDAEAIAAGSNGKTIVGFESRTRIGAYDLTGKGFKAKFQNLNPPKEIAKGPRNGELESVGYFTNGSLKGYYLAVAESNLNAQGYTKAWAWNGKRNFAFSIRQIENYNITDLAMLPNGDILLLQRSYGPLILPGMAISRFPASDIKQGKTVQPETLMEVKVPFYAIDNMEGLAVCERDGELRVNIISDNNFKTDVQRTLLLQFAYTP
ncbi:MAG TPA: esterase-like activity of phytase family protein [Aestuariivirga sp.]|nr:esterase-like activity of phytase family protein [Aestuariivirga sp.]